MAGILSDYPVPPVVFSFNSRLGFTEAVQDGDLLAKAQAPW
jgi:hypothetical protein